MYEICFVYDQDRDEIDCLKIEPPYSLDEVDFTQFPAPKLELHDLDLTLLTRNFSETFTHHPSSSFHVGSGGY